MLGFPIFLFIHLFIYLFLGRVCLRVGLHGSRRWFLLGLGMLMCLLTSTLAHCRKHLLFVFTGVHVGDEGMVPVSCNQLFAPLKRLAEVVVISIDYFCDPSFTRLLHLEGETLLKTRLTINCVIPGIVLHDSLYLEVENHVGKSG